MPTPGLDRRLQQHSRRSGLAVGLSMAATIALCVAAFTWIFVRAESVTRDFTGGAQVAAGREPTERPEAVAGVSEEGGAPKDEPAAQATRRPTEPPKPTPTPTPVAFRATHLSNPSVAVNFRPAPGTNNTPITALPPATPVQFMDEQQTGPDGLQWMRFRTQDGIEGWLREGTFVPVA